MSCDTKSQKMPDEKTLCITNFLNSRGFSTNTFEGYSQQCIQQVNDLSFLTSKPNLHVMEIGFNAGHSAEVFLQNNTLRLTSFDLGSHDYVLTAKEYIDMTYPHRHVLILGDSRVTIPKYYNENKNNKFDVIFIDGGHDYSIASADVDNCLKLAHKDTIVIVDDIMFRKEWQQGWTIGPTRKWSEYLAMNKIVELDRHEYYKGKGMAWGRYLYP
jgi:predicted O-methyltransferase YrrM